MWKKYVLRQGQLTSTFAMEADADMAKIIADHARDRNGWVLAIQTDTLVILTPATFDSWPGNVMGLVMWAKD